MFDPLFRLDAIDGWIITAGCLCALNASLLGNFLVLRKMSMLGDAITHAVLPGLAAAFLISNSRNSVLMFIGAAIVGVLTAVFTEWIRGFGKVDEGASMGVVFTALFALGLVMIVQSADHVELDPDCVLFGAIELTPFQTVSLADGFSVPRVVVVMSITLVVNALFVGFFFKELNISSFDPALATTLGIPARLIHYMLMTLVAVTAVASFESVGNILVVAMFIVPPAAAYMLTDRLGVMIALSLVLAFASAATGHCAAITVPSWFGFESTSTSGMMAVVAGLLFAAAALLSPKHGVLIKAARLRLLALRILAEDMLSIMFRIDERTPGAATSKLDLQEFLLAGWITTGVVLREHCRRGNIQRLENGFQLTERGKRIGRTLVRSHRLWELYLVDEAGMNADRIHDKAHTLEHVTDAKLRDKLDVHATDSTIDPHGRPIPPESAS